LNRIYAMEVTLYRIGAVAVEDCAEMRHSGPT
jgi:hypothetical protein